MKIVIERKSIMIMYNPSRVIYSFSPKKVDGITYNRRVENIGYTEKDIQGRFFEKKTSSWITGSDCNYVFKILDSAISLRKVEKDIHSLLRDRKTPKDWEGGREQFFAESDPLNPSEEFTESFIVIQQYLDSRGIEYDFNPNITVAPRKRRKLVAISSKRMPKKLRPFQRECMKFLSKNNKATIVAPGGSGKTYIYGKKIANIGSGRFLILVPLETLVIQICETLKSVSVPVWHYQNGMPSEIPLFVAIVSTYQSSHIYKELEFTALIFDECHRMVLYNKNPFSRFQEAVKTFKTGRYWFFTATPKMLTESEDEISMDNENIFGVFKECTYERAIEEKYIVDYVVRIIIKLKNRFKKVIKIVEETQPKKAIIFCDTIKEVNELYKKLAGKFLDYRVVKVHSKLSKDIQEDALKIFGAEKSILIACEMVSTGYDVPETDCIIHYSGVPHSYIKNSQQNGRGQRIYKDKLCYRVYYFVNEFRDISRLINLLGKTNFRFKQIIPSIISKGFLGGGLLGLCAEDQIAEISREFICPEAEITRQLVRIVLANKSPEEQLKKVLRFQNRNGMAIYDRDEVIANYRGIILDIETVCNNKENFPKFALPKNIYNNYLSSIPTDREIIAEICLKNGIKSSEDYKAKWRRHKLPNYKFLLNGGIKSIVSLTNLFASEEEDEN